MMSLQPQPTAPKNKTVARRANLGARASGSAAAVVMQGREKRRRVTAGDSTSDADEGSSDTSPPRDPGDSLRIEAPAVSPLPMHERLAASDGAPMLFGRSPPMRRVGTPDCMSSPVSHLRNLTRNMQEEARRVHAAQYLCALPSYPHQRAPRRTLNNGARGLQGSAASPLLGSAPQLPRLLTVRAPVSQADTHPCLQEGIAGAASAAAQARSGAGS
jgi:hypothetical protein